MKPEAALIGVTRLLIDTNPVIYLVERYPDDSEWQERIRKAWAILSEAQARSIELVVSPITLTEVCQKRSADRALLERYQSFCTATNEIRFEPFAFDDVFAYRAANLQRDTNLKLGDCLQIAYAELKSCEAILTNDGPFCRRSPVRGILLDDIE